MEQLFLTVPPCIELRVLVGYDHESDVEVTALNDRPIKVIRIPKNRRAAFLRESNA